MPPEVTPLPHPITLWETSLKRQKCVSRVYGAPDIANSGDEELGTVTQFIEAEAMPCTNWHAVMEATLSVS